MSNIARLPALRTWLKVHLAALVVAQVVVLGLGVSTTGSVAAPLTSTSVSSTSTTSTTSTTSVVAATTSSTTTTIVVTTTAAPIPIVAAAPRPPTTATPDPEPPPPPPEPPAAPAPVEPVASSADEQELFADHNSHRASAGLAPLQHDPCLADAARQWAAEQAASGSADHQSDLGGVVGACVDWSAAAENVGFASSATHLAELFWESSRHRANIIGSQYALVGIGVVVDEHGQRWATVLFAG